MTIEEATALAKKLKAEITEKKAQYKAMRDEETACEDRIKVLRKESQEKYAEVRSATEEYENALHVVNGLCQNGIRISRWLGNLECAGKRCEKKAKPRETLCGIHLNAKKRADEDMKRWSRNA